MHSPSRSDLQQGLEAKKKIKGHLRNYREKGPVVKNQQNKAQTSLAVAGHRQPLYGILLGNSQRSQN